MSARDGQTGRAAARRRRVVKQVLADVALFSRRVLQMPLYDYQLAPIRAVAESVLRREGREFSLIFPRQSGKNEAVAHLLVYLLNMLQRTGGNIVFGATGDALGRGIRRLEQRLDNAWNRGRWGRGRRPDRRTLGKAAVVFLSTHPLAASRGETADWLLVVDEMQDQSADHLEAAFEPMRAARNASALYIGTVRLTSDALWRKRRELGQAEGSDGRQRVFVVAPEQVTAENAAYARFPAGKVARLGRAYPIVASEYYNEPIDAAGGLSDRRQQGLMRGSHGRQEAPGPWPQGRPALLATLDVGGQDEAATDPLARLANPGRDYSVAHVFAASLERSDDPGPTYLALDLFTDQGSRHFQDTAGRPSLARRLVAWLQRWQIDFLVADESGVGAGLVDFLAARLGRRKVQGYNFAVAHGKAALGSAFLSVVETGRFRYWSGDENRPLSDGWWFFRQVEACTYELPAGGRFERDLRWACLPGPKSTRPPAGRPSMTTGCCRPLWWPFTLISIARAG